MIRGAPTLKTLSLSTHSHNNQVITKSQARRAFSCISSSSINSITKAWDLGKMKTVNLLEEKKEDKCLLKCPFANWSCVSVSIDNVTLAALAQLYKHMYLFLCFRVWGAIWEIAREIHVLLSNCRMVTANWPVREVLLCWVFLGYPETQHNS